MVTNVLSDVDRAAFQRDGVVVLRKFYDFERDILPILTAIYEIIGLVIERHGLAVRRPAFSPENFDAGYGEVIAFNRSYGGEIYDVVKQIPAFLRLVSDSRNEALIRELRRTDLVGVGAGSYGIRIDNPGEEQFRSQWHQEYLFQPQSIDGVVLWTPLVEIREETGPVIYCLGSHRDGLQKYLRHEAYSSKIGAYQISLYDEDKVTGKYRHLAPLTAPGDVIVMDYLTIHQSGYNTSKRSRWSIQSRFFNFRDASGLKTGWKASVTAGTDIEKVFADYFVQ